MLIKRIITAVILIPIVIWMVLSLKGLAFMLVAALFILLTGIEWMGVCGFTHPIQKVAFLLSLILSIGLLACFGRPWILAIASIFWLLPLIWVCTFEKTAPLLLSRPLGKALAGVIVLSSSWYALTALSELRGGGQWILLLFILVWSADTFAYFAGKRWGKQPLARSISPNKTIQGFWGGVIGAWCMGMIALGIISLLDVGQGPAVFVPDVFPLWAFISFITILFSVLGDLFESLLKRLSNVKDSGRMLPGHGGLLDRVDSLLGALPLYALLLTLLMEQCYVNVWR